jgi:hypothetical protein
LGIKFYGDIVCVAYVLNFSIQDILKVIIKNKYDSLDNNTYSIENNKDEDTTSKFFFNSFNKINFY